MANHPELPLHGAPIDEIALTAAPLVTVIAQVRFPTLLSVRSADRIIGFQELIRATYPHLEKQDIPTIIFGPGTVGGSIGETQVHWRFADGTTDWKWKISLAQDFIALETRAYTSRKDFLERLEAILNALENTLAPTHVVRFGIRYIDQIKGDAVTRIGKLLRKEVLGVACSLGADAKQLFTEILVPAEPGELAARWGKMPAGVTIDPNLLPPLQQESWLLDLDVSKTETSVFETKAVIETARLAAERVYTVFRWMVTPEFLTTYGGKV
jgi:uncharacterized protein (TIGR04255 family)